VVGTGAEGVGKKPGIGFPPRFRKQLTVTWFAPLCTYSCTTDIETKYHFTFPRDMYVVSLDFLLFLPIATTVYSKKLHCLLQSNTFFFIASNFLNAASGMLFCSYEAAASNPVAID